MLLLLQMHWWQTYWDKELHATAEEWFPNDAKGVLRVAEEAENEAERRGAVSRKTYL